MPMEQLACVLGAFPLVINTVPSLLLDEQKLSLLAPKALVLDLASKPGGDGVGDTHVQGGGAMDKQKIYWITGLVVVAAAAIVSMWLQTPHAPVILTYQMSEPPVTEEQAVPWTEPVQSELRQMTVPTETTATVTTTQAEPPEPLCYDLNEASAEDLKRVSGIGDVLAEAIVAYREQIGGFTRRTQLLAISGIGEVLMERIMAEFEIPDELPPEEPGDIEPQAPEPDEPPDDEPEPQETEPPEPDLPPQPTGPYNVNTVTREELLTIPDMTEELADAILDMRERLRGYTGIYEVMLAGPSGVYFEDVLHQYLYVVGDPHSIQPET